METKFPAISVTDDFKETEFYSYETTNEAVNAYGKFHDWGFATWSKRVDLYDGDGKRIATKWFKSYDRDHGSLTESINRIKKLGGMESVDVYLDLQEPNVPWEGCIDCEEITPRDPVTLKCVFEVDHE